MFRQGGDRGTCLVMHGQTSGGVQGPVALAASRVCPGAQGRDAAGESCFARNQIGSDKRSTSHFVQIPQNSSRGEISRVGGGQQLS